MRIAQPDDETQVAMLRRSIYCLCYSQRMRNLVLENVNEESSHEVSEGGDIQKYVRPDKCARKNLRELLKNKIDKGNIFCSFELFPENDRNSVYQRFVLYTEIISIETFFLTKVLHLVDFLQICVSSVRCSTH